ncbi:hypothetical protein NERG_00612 [Nematocida ausubeli]|uniref:Plasma membrane proteolipid 3 n=1 Tax=Nematocida ausubeli (strain ATCC PRA-371 / ERTm2) TaxID=1913371 RepID=H8ZAL3_NEMA1|nr:hypothetical protein NERG_00612 [Nematocida ausubeli]
MSCATLLEILLAIFLPPVSVFLVSGCGIDLLINLLLCLLAYFPASIHALYLVSVQHSNSSSNEN